MMLNKGTRPKGNAKKRLRKRKRNLHRKYQPKFKTGPRKNRHGKIV